VTSTVDALPSAVLYVVVRRSRPSRVTVDASVFQQGSGSSSSLVLPPLWRRLRAPAGRKPRRDAPFVVVA
jgi:hypothetical protein